MRYPQSLWATCSSHRHIYSRASESSAGVSVALIQWQQPSLQTRQHRRPAAGCNLLWEGRCPPSSLHQAVSTLRTSSWQSHPHVLPVLTDRARKHKQQHKSSSSQGWVRCLLLCSSGTLHARAEQCSGWEKAASARQWRVSELGQPALLQRLQGT